MTTPEQDDQPTATQLHDARGWLLDCGFRDELVDDLTDRQVMRFVDLEYDGGWTAFLIESTGYPIDRPDCLCATIDTAVARWTVMLAKADALGLPHADEDTDSASTGGSL